MSTPFISDPDFFEKKIRGMWLTGPSGDEFRTHGDGAGDRGVWNAKGQVKGIYDAPVKTTWKTGASQEGSTQKAVKRLHRDMELGFHVTETRVTSPSGQSSAEDNESEFRKMFGYEPDEWDDEADPTTLHIETDKSGERKLDLLLSDTPICEPDLDPIMQQYFNLILKLRAGQPNWYENDVITKFDDGATHAVGDIEVSNPTDQPMRHKWILTRATWVLPDFSWKGGAYHRKPGGIHKDRTIPMFPITDIQGGITVSLNQQDLMVRDVHYTNCLPLLQGKIFQYIIPPYTPKQRLPISYTDAPAGGAMAQLVQPRRWSRPWGLE